MFTGLVSAVGEVQRVEPARDGRDLTILAPYQDVEEGESIAVAGACLTVTSRGPGWFRVRAVGPTLERTRLGELAAGARVNLERALRAGDPLGGHLVQGHVDGIGEVRAVRKAAESRLVSIQVPAPVWAAAVPLGSVTVDGVSLTVNAVAPDGILQVSLIPYTLEHTTLGALGVGDRVHLEADVIGKYVRAFLEQGVGRELFR